MRVMVHGGLPKTGSSALQNYFANHREAFRAIGVHYPDFGHVNHWMVTAALVKVPERYAPTKRLRGKEIGDELGPVIATLQSLVADDTSDDILLISHEDLGVLRNAQKLVDVLEAAAGRPIDVHLVAYIRNPVLHYPSAIQQSLKEAENQSFVPSKWISPHIIRAARLQESFKKTLTLRLHAPADTLGWDAIEDFRSFFRATFKKTLPMDIATRPVNSSLSAQACSLLELIEIVGGQNKQNATKLRHKIMRFDETEPRTKLMVPSSWNEEIAMANGKRWNTVLRKIDLPKDLRIKSRFFVNRLETTGAKPCDQADFRTWLLSYLDLDYIDRLAAFCRVRRPNEIRAEWLDLLSARLRDLGVDGTIAAGAIEWPELKRRLRKKMGADIAAPPSNGDAPERADPGSVGE